MFVFITGLTDNYEDIKKELQKCKREFLNLFEDIIQHKFDMKTFEVFDPTVDSIHRNLRPKISLIGFSGVGKTTITRLIKAEEIPMQHIPTITGDIATIKIGKLHFHLWDFAGQEQFSYLWSNFIKGSDATLLITDSTLENVEKSKFFLELIKEQAPNAHSAVIANKQDLENAMKPNQIEDILGLKAYSMVAIDPDNRDKMIKIIADILEMNTAISPLLKPLLERDEKMREAQQALEDAQFEVAANLFEEISDLCIDLGDDSLSKEFYEKAQKIKTMLGKIVSEEPPKVEKKESTIKDLEVFEDMEEEIEEGIDSKAEMELTTEDLNLNKVEKPVKTETEGSFEVQEKVPSPSQSNVPPPPPTQDIPSEPEKPKKFTPLRQTLERENASKAEEKEPTTEEEVMIKRKESEFIGVKLNPEDFMVKQKPKQVASVPKDAKNKLKTSAYGHVTNPNVEVKQPTSTPSSEIAPPPYKDTTPKITEHHPPEPVSKSPESPSLTEQAKMELPIGEKPSIADAPSLGETPASTNKGLTTQAQKEHLKKELMDLKIKKAKVSKMSLDFEMQELSGEISAEELTAKQNRLEKLEAQINQQIKDLEDMINN